ncbi:MAG: glycosyltransferase family 2 protein [Schaedlerella sp.]|nr:glycosyltransferase family 2 protein [Schaedlerella sp.]
MDVSIIIINYKTPDLVVDCVRSIKQLTKDISYEVIVVDNDSNDGSVNILNKELSGDVKLIESDINLGFGKANNLGVKYAKGNYVFLLNSDTILINNAVKILHDYIIKDKNIGIVGGNLYSADLKENSSFCLTFDDIETVKKQSSWMYIIGDILFRQFRQRFYSEEQRRQYIYKNTFNHTNQPMEVGYIFGTDMMLSRSLYHEMNGFDPEFFMYAEEEELSWRIHQKGYRIVNVPTAKIIHLDGGTFKKDDSFNAKQYTMRMTGTMVYYKKRFGANGIRKFYHYKMRYLMRQYNLARVMKRSMLYSITKIQMDCLKEQYNTVMQGNIYEQAKR